jgi:hypothetical protein
MSDAVSHPAPGEVVFSVVDLRFYPEHRRREDELMAISCFVLAPAVRKTPLAQCRRSRA